MIYFIYDTDNNKYYGVYNNVSIMNNNLDFLKKENIVKNHSIFKLDNLHFEMKLEEEPRNYNIKQTSIYLLYNDTTNKFITYHNSSLYLENMITFFEKEYMIIKVVLNSMYIDLEQNTKITVDIEDRKEEPIEKKVLLEEEKVELFELNRELNILKLQQKRLQEKKVEFEANCELYQRFKKEKENDITFIIPELFSDKFNLMKNLEETDKLTFENYINMNPNKFLENSYSMMFEGGSSVKISEI